MERAIFGHLEDGTAVESVTLRGGGLTADLLTWGCVVRDLRMDGGDHPLVLGYDTLEPYLSHSPYFGATVGRYANRIANGRFALDGESFQLDRNFLGRHTLHGGRLSLGRRNWSFLAVKADRATLGIDDPDGTMGFPGNCRIRAEFALLDGGRLRISYEADTDRPTLINLAHHSYFNLAGDGDVLDHEIRIDAETYLPVDAGLIPDGPPRSVAGTPFDFRSPRPLAFAVGGRRLPYDHNFCLSDRRVPCREVAAVRSPRSGVVMTVATTEPGLQFYDGAGIVTPVPGLGGRAYGACAGLCLEPQIWPDSPNRPDFPSAVIRPGEKYRQQTEYRFAPG